MASVKDVYRHVIDEVMKNVKNDFYTEGLDDEVIRNVQKLWETYVEAQMAAVPSATDSSSAAPAATPSATIDTTAPTAGVTTGGASYAGTYPHFPSDQSGTGGDYASGGFNPYGGGNGSAQRLVNTSGRPATQMAPTHVDQQQAYLTSLPASGTAGQNRGGSSSVPQLDGEDGGDDNNEDEEGKGEEPEIEELGSEDDIADSEDGDGTDEPKVDNLLIAQFDKVNRSKSKWKATLKDGVIHINGRDHLFVKATGEFSW